MNTKIMCIILILVICIGLAGCTEESTTNTTDDPTNSSGGNNDGSGTENNTNASAQTWFKADLYTFNYKAPRSEYLDSDRYYCGMSAYWDPVPYVQYYQLKFEFNGNDPALYGWACDFRNQGHAYCNENPLNWEEGIIYQLGGNPTNDTYVGALESGELTYGSLNEDTGEMENTVYGRLFPEGAHGWKFIRIRDEVLDSEELSGTEISVLQDDMQTFIEEYTSGWEIWVKAVTETND